MLQQYLGKCPKVELVISLSGDGVAMLKVSLKYARFRTIVCACVCLTSVSRRA